MKADLNTILTELSLKNVTLIAVSKLRSIPDIMSLYNQGQRDFGENRVQELLSKAPNMPPDIRWHLIGHLQTNKVKYIAPFIFMIHSVDSLSLFMEIEKQAKKLNRRIPCLLQFYIAKEETKFGLEVSEANELLNSIEFRSCQYAYIAGVMGMATYTANKEQIRSEFGNLKSIFSELKISHFNNNPEFKEISMGMSGDYQIAMEEGSTMVRIGTLLFE